VPSPAANTIAETYMHPFLSRPFGGWVTGRLRMD
jgi:hypothetical protein